MAVLLGGVWFSKTLAFNSPLLEASVKACDAEELFEFKALQNRKPATVGPSSSTAAPLEDACNLEADLERIITEEEELHKAAMAFLHGEDDQDDRQPQHDHDRDGQDVDNAGHGDDDDGDGGGDGGGDGSGDGHCVVRMAI